MAEIMAEIVKDLKGGTLRLTRTKLVELTGQTGFSKWTLELSELKSPRLVNGCLWVDIHRPCVFDGANDIVTCVMCAPKNHKIGCRTFSARTFNKIMRAAGVKPLAKAKRPVV